MMDRVAVWIQDAAVPVRNAHGMDQTTVRRPKEATEMQQKLNKTPAILPILLLQPVTLIAVNSHIAVAMNEDHAEISM